MQSRMYCQVSISSSLCCHLIRGLTAPAPQIPPFVGSNHALHILLEEIHLSPDCLVSLFIKSVLLVSFSFSPLLFLLFELHLFPPIIQLSLPSFSLYRFMLASYTPQFLSSHSSLQKHFPCLLQMSSQRSGEKRCMSARGKNKGPPCWTSGSQHKFLASGRFNTTHGI